MGTKVIYVISGNNSRTNEKLTARLYQSGDGHPETVMPALVKALRNLNSIGEKRDSKSKSTNALAHFILAEISLLTFGDCIWRDFEVSQKSSEYNVCGTLIDAKEVVDPAEYKENFKPKHLGKQWDLYFIRVGV